MRDHDQDRLSGQTPRGAGRFPARVVQNERAADAMRGRARKTDQKPDGYAGAGDWQQMTDAKIAAFALSQEGDLT